MRRLTIPTPTGPFTLTERDGAIVRATWGGTGGCWSPLLTRASDQIAAYFAGLRQAFDLPLRVEASDAQQRVCAAIAAIPFGDTRTYGEIGAELDLRPQRVGQACGANPIALLIPCHRVMGANGLGGFSGGAGVETKVWLLKHEGGGGLLI